MLTKDQQDAYDRVFQYLADPQQQVFVIEGYAGCGKSFLVNKIIKNLPDFYAKNQQLKLLTLELTATTNKAAESLFEFTEVPVKTTFSLLGLRVTTDYSTGKSRISLKFNAQKVYDSLIFVDEAFFADKQLLSYLFSQTENCKIILVGDPAQLSMGNNGSPISKMNWPTARLTEVVRQAKGSPIIDLATGFRNTVNGADWPSIQADGKNIIRLSMPEMEEQLNIEFIRPGWHFKDSKVLAYFNKKVIAYNHHIRDIVKSEPQLCAGDYATVNSFISVNGKGSYKTDEAVLITKVEENANDCGVNGKLFFLNNNPNGFFMPNSLLDKTTLLKQAKKQSAYNTVQHIEQNWIDLRATYSSTVDKSQGSTYKKVFVDLNDISKCTSGNRMARMLYVACSRPKDVLYLCGDFI